MTEPRATARPPFVKDERIRTPIEAAMAFGIIIGAQGSLTADEAARVFAGMLPGDWNEEDGARRRYFLKRAQQILEKGSRRNPVYDEPSPDGDVWYIVHPE